MPISFHIDTNITKGFGHQPDASPAEKERSSGNDHAHDVDSAVPIFLPRPQPQSKPQQQSSITQFLPNPHSIDFTTAKGATLAFALMNTDFLNFDFSDVATTPGNALALMIQWLTAIQTQLPKESQLPLKHLLKKFHTAFEVEMLQDRLTRIAETETALHEAKWSIIDMLTEKLNFRLVSLSCRPSYQPWNRAL